MFNSNPNHMSNSKRRWSNNEVTIAKQHITSDVPLTFNQPQVTKVASIIGRSPESVCAKMTQVRIRSSQSTRLSTDERKGAVIALSKLLFDDNVSGDLYFKLMRIVQEHTDE